jgi:hypothetical protein
VTTTIFQDSAHNAHAGVGLGGNLPDPKADAYP